MSHTEKSSSDIPSDDVLILYYIPETYGLREIKYEHYKLIKYNSESTLNPNNGFFRSVIYSNDELCCFSPQKSIHSKEFMESNKINNIQIEEFIEGTMINLFFDKHIQNWMIASKSNIGANCKFFNTSITFHNMYLECLSNTNLNYDQLNRNYCYSFIIQHPTNRIVIPFETTHMYLINVYHCTSTDKFNIIRNINIHSNEIKELFNNTTIQFPKLYHFDSYDSISMPNSWMFKGFMLKTDFHRCKILNPTYEHIKDLRGNQPKLKYCYLMLRKNKNTLDEFLIYYPEYKSDFNQFETDIKNYTRLLFQTYISCFIHKMMKLREYSPKFKTHMYNLHQLYIQKLSSEKKYITYAITEDYINSLHPSQLMYTLNFDLHYKSELVSKDSEEYLMI